MKSKYDATGKYKSKECTLCHIIYQPTSGSQKVCAGCKPKYDKLLSSLWRKNNRERWNKMNRDLQRKWRKDPKRRAQLQEYARKSRRNRIKKYGPEYKKLMRQRTADTRKLIKLTAIAVAKCSVCGSGWPLICHHRDGNPTNHDEKNLIWVCKKCHESLHKKIKSRPLSDYLS